MRHGVESQGLLEQLSIELQELARVGRASIRDDKADIQILSMLGELRDEALLREVHREGAELNTKVPCDMASDLLKQCLSPGHQHDKSRLPGSISCWWPGERHCLRRSDAAICRANSGPIPDEAPVTSAHGPNCCLSSNAFMFPPLLSTYTRQLLRDLLLQLFRLTTC